MSTPSTRKQTLEWEQARQLVIDTVRTLACQPANELVPLTAAHGRVLVEALHADRDYPTLRRSLRDGYAVRSTEVPGMLRIRGEVRAGDGERNGLAPGEALEIMTGAPVPDEADAVVMVEHATRLDGGNGTAQVKIDQAIEPGKWINVRGAEAPQGSLLVPSGTTLDASHIAMLATTGQSEVRVSVKPSVAILATGDEIVDVNGQPAPHQIRNSNSYMLAALARACGGETHILPVAPDNRADLQALLEQGVRHSLLLVSGGVSAGRYDLVKPCLRQLGTEFIFERVRIQPGGPCAFGLVGSTAVFGLPGNPGSSYVTFQLFAQAALELLVGETQPILPLLRARFEAPFRHRLGLTRFLPARLSNDGEHLTHIPWQGSSDVPALSKANAFLVAEHDRELWAAGDEIRVMRKL